MISNYISYVYIYVLKCREISYKFNIILNNVRQHNYFITQGNYTGYMFRP